MRHPIRLSLRFASLALSGLSGVTPADETRGVDVELSGGARDAVEQWERPGSSRESLAGLARAGMRRRALDAVTPNPDHDDDYPYRLPYGDAVSYPVLQGYGSRLSHRGSEQFTVDFKMAEGTLVHSAREGQVLIVEDSFAGACWDEGCGRLANFVVILHADGTTGEYFHLEQGGALVAPGEYVSRGQPIARSGNTGYSTTPHLHFGVYRRSVDGSTQSIAVRFLTRQGLLKEPRSGARYQNVQEERDALSSKTVSTR